MFVGVGASRVRDMFEQGKKTPLVSFSLMKLTRSDGIVVPVLAVVMMNANKP